MSKEKVPGWNYTDDTDMGADAALLGSEALGTVRHAKSEWQKAQEAGDQKGMDYWHGVAEDERAKAGYSGGANGGGYIGLASTVKEPDYGEAPTEYKTAMDRAIQTLQGRGKFTYDPETDPNYQAYKEQYTRLGKQAMEDSYGHAALRTGGLGGSAAMTASQQAYNGYMQALADKIPELRQIAYQMWQDEDDRVRRDIDLYGSLDQQGWNRWNSDRDFQRGAFESDRSFDYNKGVDQWNMARQLDRDAKTDAETERTWQWKQEQRDYERGSEEAAMLASTGDYSGYAQLWGMSEEAVQALVAKYAKEERLTEEQAARDLADWYAQYGDYSKARALGVTPQLKTSGGSGGGGKNPVNDDVPEGSLAEAALEWAEQFGGNAEDWVKKNYKKYGYTNQSAALADLAVYQTEKRAARTGDEEGQKTSGGAASLFASWWGLNPGAAQMTQGAVKRTAQTVGAADYKGLLQKVSGATSGQTGELVDQIQTSLSAGAINPYQASELLKRIGY